MEPSKMYSLIAKMNAIMIEVEAMKAANVERENNGYALAYDEKVFVDTAKEIHDIAEKLNNV